MSKRYYKVTDSRDGAKTIVRASTQAAAIRHCVRGRYTAVAAKAEDIYDYMKATKGAPIEDAAEQALPNADTF